MFVLPSLSIGAAAERAQEADAHPAVGFRTEAEGHRTVNKRTAEAVQLPYLEQVSFPILSVSVATVLLSYSCE